MSTATEATTATSTATPPRGATSARHVALRAPWDDNDDAREAALDRVALLVPAIAHAARRDPLDYALAYVERYGQDVVQLEREWDFLCGALDLAWRREERTAALRIAAALTYPAGRCGRSAEGERVVRLGIESARHAGDRRQLGLFVNRLGGLRFAQGHYQQGWRLWRAGLELDAARPGWWSPCISFATCVDLLGRVSADERILDLLLGEQSREDTGTLAVALFVRGFRVARRGQRDAAHDDISAALRLWSGEAGNHPAEPWHVLVLTMQTELARLRGEHGRVRECAATAIALARLAGDIYTWAALITDQALYCYYQGWLDESRALLRSLDSGPPGAESLPIALRGRRFLREFLEEPLPVRPPAPAALAQPGGTTDAQAAGLVRLSARETEVLRLVAAGHSTRVIAAMLVVTPATVKKHLEHAYARLDAHSRTAAVAAARALGLLS